MELCALAEGGRASGTVVLASCTSSSALGEAGRLGALLPVPHVRAEVDRPSSMADQPLEPVVEADQPLEPVAEADGPLSMADRPLELVAEGDRPTSRSRDLRILLNIK